MIWLSILASLPKTSNKNLCHLLADIMLQCTWVIEAKIMDVVARFCNGSYLVANQSVLIIDQLIKLSDRIPHVWLHLPKCVWQPSTTAAWCDTHKQGRFGSFKFQMCIALASEKPHWAWTILLCNRKQGLHKKQTCGSTSFLKTKTTPACIEKNHNSCPHGKTKAYLRVQQTSGQYIRAHVHCSLYQLHAATEVYTCQSFLCMLHASKGSCHANERINQCKMV